MATIRELVTVWGFDVDAKPLEQIETQLGRIQDSVKVVGALAIGAGAALFGMAKLTSQAGNEIKITSDKVGLSTDALQEYRFAAEQAGVESSRLDSLFFNLNKTIGDARQGFGNGRVGIELLARETGTLINLNGTVESQFNTITDALLRVKDEAKRASIAEQFFGGDGRELATLLNQGSGAINKYREEFRQLNGVMGKDLIESSRKFERSLSVVKAIATGIRNEIGQELLPIMVEVVGEFKEWFMANKDLVKQNIKSTISTLVTIFKSMSSVLKLAYQFAASLATNFGGLEKVSKDLFVILAAILGLKMAHSFGIIAQTVGGLVVQAFTAAGRAALFAQAKMLLIPLAITGIIAAVALIAEDIIGFANGKDSVFGRMLVGLDNIFGEIRKKFSIFADIGEFLVAAIATPIRVIVNAIQSIGAVIDMIKGKVGILKGLGSIAGNLANTFGIGGFGDAKSMFGFEGNIKNPSAPQPKSSGTTNNTSAKIDINVAGLPPEQAQQAAREGIESALGKVLRQTSRDTEPARVR